MEAILYFAIRDNFPKTLLFFICLCAAEFSFSQEITDAKDTLNFRSDVSVTNNGFSFNPAFTLGKPAAMLEMAIGWKRFSFEPQFRFSLEGKPWGFIFIYRYKVIAKKKFQFSVGTHLPGMPFINRTVTSGGVTSNAIVVNRYVVGELIPTYSITRKTYIGIYYNLAHGLEKEAIQLGQFFSLRAGFSNVKLSKKFEMSFAPQLFYMKLDEREGYYGSANLSIAKINFPISIGSGMYNAFQSDIAGKDFNWNLTVTYSFNKNFAATKN